MEFALKQIKNPPQEVPMANASTFVDKKTVETKEDYTPLSEEDAKRFKIAVENKKSKELKPTPTNMTVGGKTVYFTDGKGNMYGADKRRIDA